MLKLAIGIMVTYWLGQLFGWVLHRFLHSKRAGKLYRSHLTHHRLYTIADFTSLTYRQAGADSTTWIFILAAVPIGIIPILLTVTGVIDWMTMIVVIIEMITIGWINSYLHDSFHLTNHWLSQVPGFRKWYQRMLAEHWEHHKHVQHNLGIYSFITDRVLGTYWTGIRSTHL